MARIVTMIMRIAAICKPHNINLSIAATVFLNAGVVILFIVNLLFAQRLIRAQHPRLGWNPVFSALFKATYALIVISIIMLITAAVQMFFTLNTNTRRIDRDIQLYGVTFFAIASFLPLPLVVGGLLIPRRDHALDKFGHGRWREKIWILMTASTLICFGAAYRAACSWHTPVPRTQPMPAHFAKGAFYVVNFTVEILVVYLYGILRVDLRFHVPDSARGPGSYQAGAAKAAEEKKLETEKEEAAAKEQRRPSSTRKPSLHRVFSEEETFDDDPRPDLDEPSEGNNTDVEKGLLGDTANSPTEVHAAKSNANKEFKVEPPAHSAHAADGQR
jgi:Protein of unknown function (DUF3112)